MQILVTAQFKKMATRAIFSILLFICTYLILVGLSVALTIALGYAGIMLIVFKPMFLTLMLGIGIISVGFFILVFLVKFIFKKHETDRSHLMMVTAYEQPHLFKIIEEVVSDVKTQFPKKVYLSGEVNASVFYDSSFWSMFFPVRKNLLIGVGLINAVSTSELKAILAHEFGHFSQRSMKVGSYVYNVNQVIYNMLYDNEGYGNALNTWANTSSYFTVFSEIAVKIVGVIQYVLRKVYEVVNLSYMALSREMEFHADEVAANVTGPQPLINSLLRLQLADQSFSNVLSYYGERIDKNINTKNIFPQHLWMLNFIGNENNLTAKNGIPQLTTDDISRFNKTKLVIKDQWSSHPSTEERVEYLQKLQVIQQPVDDTHAATLLQGKEAIEEHFTTQIFMQVTYEQTPEACSVESFATEYAQVFQKTAYPKMFNSYYDNKFDGLELPTESTITSVNAEEVLELFNAKAVDLVFTTKGLENDIATLKELAKGKTKIKTLDYDGHRYTIDDCTVLLTQLEVELKENQERLKRQDETICANFFWLAKQQGKEGELINFYNTFNKVFAAYDRRFEIHTRMANETVFLQHTTPYEQIESNFITLKSIEEELKSEISFLLEDEDHAKQITPEIRDSFKKYIDNKSPYFTRPEYHSEVLNLLFETMSNYPLVIGNTLIQVKKNLLDYEAELAVIAIVRKPSIVFI